MVGPLGKGRTVGRRTGASSEPSDSEPELSMGAEGSTLGFKLAFLLLVGRLLIEFAALGGAGGGTGDTMATHLA